MSAPGAGTGAAGPARVALVLVSHADVVAEGTAWIARQMAPDVAFLPAGGADGRIGTSVGTVQAAVESAGTRVTGEGSGVVVLTDLGSAVMSTQAAVEVVEALDPDLASRVRVPSAPFVEGAVAAAVEAQQGGDLETVVAAAVAAGRVYAPAVQVGGEAAGRGPDDVDAEARAPGAQGDEPPGTVAETVVLAPGMGLHARPAALLARAVAALGVPVRLDGANGASMLEVMGLGASGGSEVRVTAHGPGAEEAVRAVVRMLAEGLDA